MTGDETASTSHRDSHDSALVDTLRERANSYRTGGPSSEHTALLLDRAAEEIYCLRLLLIQIDSALCVHGKIEAGTDLHDKIQRADGVE